MEIREHQCAKTRERKVTVMSYPKKTYPLYALVICLSLLAGCGSKPAEATALTGDARDAVLAFSEAKTDNLLAGLNTDDYAAFSKDFDSDMLNAMTPGQFTKLKQDRDAKLGRYLSRTVSSVIQTGDFYAVNYQAVFEKEAEVALRVVFRVAAPHQVSGLWFNK